MVDAGNYLHDARDYHGELRPDATVKNGWIMRAYDEFQMDAANVSSHELRHLSRISTTNGSERQTERQKTGSVSARMVSANIASEPSAVKPFAPFIVQQVRTRGGRVVKIAFLGLTESIPAPPRGFKIIDPADAARAVVPAARKQADLVIALARVKQAEAVSIAKQVPGLDAMIVAGADSLIESLTLPQTVGKTRIVFTSYETRSLGELRFYEGAGGGFSSKLRYIALDEVVPDDGAALDVANRAKAAEDQAARDARSQLDEWLETSRAIGRKAGTGSAFVGSQECARCHQRQYIESSSSAHAQATAVLVSRPFEFRASCVACHAWEKSPDGRPLQGISCEQCHGPGAAHAAKPAKGYGRVNPGQACLICHTPEVSPGFDLRSALAKVKH